MKRDDGGIRRLFISGFALLEQLRDGRIAAENESMGHSRSLEPIN
jgi:hypothetical protein